ncbi:MAG: hypothetical protein WDW38_001257 [Sanguina aurantia]
MLSSTRKLGLRPCHTASIKRVVVVRVHAAAQEAPKSPVSPATTRAYKLLQAKPKTGAEYGQGFVEFRMSGTVQLDVDTMNERLKHTGVARLRHQQHPDEQYGIILNFDTVITNTRMVQSLCWQQLAKAHGTVIPPLRDNLVLFNSTPERVIMDVLRWTSNPDTAAALSWELAALLAVELESLSEPCPGVREWVASLTKYKVPIAIVSELDKFTVRLALQRMRLDDHFTVLVSAEDDMDNTAQRYLSASLQLQRPPNLCVVFDALPEAITAAHNCTMKAVAVCGLYPAYALKQADVTCGRLSELTVYNIRRLFANQGSDFMSLELQTSNDKPKQGRKIVKAVFH